MICSYKSKHFTRETFDTTSRNYAMKVTGGISFVNADGDNKIDAMFMAVDAPEGENNPLNNKTNIF